MYKIILFIFFSCLLCNSTSAQRRDTAAYYMNGLDRVASSQEQALYVRYIYPPTPADSFYLVKDYYKSGNPKFTTHSVSSDPESPNSFDGTFVAYYANGKRKRVGTYNHGKVTGEYVDYYSTGKPYCSVLQNPDSLYLEECRDTSGKVIAENGNGKWIKYNENFSTSITGNIVNGKEEGEWTGLTEDSLKYTQEYNKGKFKEGNVYFKTGKSFHFNTLDVPPEFSGGTEALIKYLSRNIKYPSEARRNNVTGRVIITFVVDGSGKVSDARVLRGIGSGCDEEALRVINASPAWTPGIQNGMPVRVQYSIPIAFSVTEQIQPFPVKSSF